MSFLDSAFPAVVTSTDFDVIMYNRIANAITAVSAVMATVSDNAGNIELGATYAVKFGGTSAITFVSPNITVGDLEIITDPWTFTGDLPISGNCTVSNDFTVDDTGSDGDLILTGDLGVTGYISFVSIRHKNGADAGIAIAQIAEPDDPPDEHAVMWCSNGTGVGDVGDIMIKIQHGSVVKSKTLVNFA